LKKKNNILSKLYDHEKLNVQEIVDEYLKFDEAIDQYITDVPHYLHTEMAKGKSILLEGAQGTLLDIDHGTYPFVTSSSPTSGGACTGSGIPPTKIDSVIGIVKAYTTRVGNGPFPTELFDDDGENLRKWGAEFGATTGRPRRCGWFDAFMLKFSTMINGIDEAAVTKIDVLSGLDEIKVCIGYELNGKSLKSYPTDAKKLEMVKPVYKTLKGWKKDISEINDYNDLPQETKDYLKFISEFCGFRIRFVSVGPKRKQTMEI
jgi:adenylosuccinate synthase